MPDDQPEVISSREECAAALADPGVPGFYFRRRFDAWSWKQSWEFVRPVPMISKLWWMFRWMLAKLFGAPLRDNFVYFPVRWRRGSIPAQELSADEQACMENAQQEWREANWLPAVLDQPVGASNRIVHGGTLSGDHMRFAFLSMVTTEPGQLSATRGVSVRGASGTIYSAAANDAGETYASLSGHALEQAAADLPLRRFAEEGTAEPVAEAVDALHRDDAHKLLQSTAIEAVIPSDPVDPSSPIDLAALGLRCAHLAGPGSGSMVKWILALVTGALFFGWLAFLGSARTGFIILAVLVVHELCHMLMMKLLGYRDLRLLLIPGFGGAAIGSPRGHVSGLQQAAVALAGPVLCLILTLAGGLALINAPDAGIDNLHWRTVLVVSGFLNGFNLLPLMPLDGGWTLHAVLTCRMPWFDLVWRGMAAAVLGWIGVTSGSWLLAILAFLILRGLPARVAAIRTAAILKSEPLVKAWDRRTPPPWPVLVETVRRTQESDPRLAGAHPFTLQRAAAGVLALLSVRPPGLIASLAIIAVYLAGFWLAALCVATGMGLDSAGEAFAWMWQILAE